MIKRIMTVLVLMLVATTAVSAHPRSVQLRVDQEWSGCSVPAVRFHVPTWPPAELIIRLDGDEEVNGKIRRSVTMFYHGLDFDRLERDSLRRLLVQDGFPTETNMRFVRYLASHWFATSTDSTTHGEVVYILAPQGARPSMKRR